MDLLPCWWLTDQFILSFGKESFTSVYVTYQQLSVPEPDQQTKHLHCRITVTDKINFILAFKRVQVQLTEATLQWYLVSIWSTNWMYYVENKWTNIYTTGKNAKECTKFISVQYISFFSESNIRTGNCGRNKGHKCPHFTRMWRLHVYFPFSMTLHSPMLQQHKGIGFRMCCRQATDKKGITPACLGFSMTIRNNKTKGDFF